MKSVFVCGTNSNHSLLYHGSQSIMKKKPIKIDNLIENLFSKENIKFINCGSSMTILTLNSGDLIIWGLEQIQENEKKEKEKEKEKENHLMFSKENIKKISKSIFQIHKFKGKNIQMISCGSFSILILVENKVYLSNLLLPSQKKMQIIFEEISSFQKEKIIINSICAGSTFYFAVDEKKNLYSWGDNSYGQLGLSDTKSREKPELIVQLNQSISQISAGSHHFIALTPTNKLFSCGRNRNGQLGLNDFDDRKTPELIQLNNQIGTLIKIFCADETTFLLNEFGKVYICGKMYKETEIQPQKQAEFIELIFPENAIITKIFGNGGYGESYSLFIDSNGKGYGFGSNKFGALGIESNQPQNKPKRINLPDDHLLIDCGCGWTHSCFITNSKENQNVVYLSKKEIKQELIEEKKKIRSFGNFHVLPPEQIIPILEYLNHQQLCMISMVSEGFHSISSQNWLWKPIFDKYIGLELTQEEKEIFQNPELQDFEWKFISVPHLSPYGKVIYGKNVKNLGFGSVNKKFFGKKSKKVLMLGLDNSGRTVILYGLKIGEVVTTIPTIGFNVETIKKKGFSFHLNIWEVSGGYAIRSLWRHYFNEVDALVWAIDVHDQRIEESKTELLKLLKDENLKEVKCVLIICTKLDIPNGLKTEEIVKLLGLDEFDKIWGVFPTSQQNLSTFWKASFRWLVWILMFMIKNQEKEKENF
ncbi:adp-ribosylation factor 4b-related [Anaeramoeba ignava]|uniref:Adp-ribosylation factor 4b-related n=1 Tax=Anaeramoeba ignava TaxID=1746090 RepID=A0A9Q0LCE9_ANAIG|nr:adp-ribosylation factor 4b-related [Anaeramoeba ignava]